MLRRYPWFAGLLVGFLLQAGCTTPTKQIAAPVPCQAATRSKSATRSLPAVAVPEDRKPSQQPPVAMEQPHYRESPSSSLRKLLPKTCVVIEATATTLLVKSWNPTESPSLFEEAIALSKLRGLLTARPAIPKDTPQKTRLQNGTATIPFGKLVAPADAADAVVAALSVDGVQRVRVVLNAN